MSGGLRDYVFEQPLYDVHEHHMPEILGDRDVGLAKLFEQSYAGWTQARPYRVGPEVEVPPADFDVAAYVEGSGSNAFVVTVSESAYRSGAVSEIEGSAPGLTVSVAVLPAAIEPEAGVTV